MKMSTYLKIYIINVCLIFISIYFTVYSFLNINFLKVKNIDEFSNNYCQNNPSSIICKNKYKKNKFIWIFLDGNAYDQLVLLKDKAKYKIPIIFRGKGDGYKHTNPLFTSMFSGVINRNVLRCDKIEKDQIFKQLHQSNYKMHLLGISEPVNKLNGENNLEIFDKKHIFEEHEDCSFCSFCNVTYPISDSWCEKYYKTITDRDQKLLNGISKEKLYEDLDKHFKIENNDIMKDINLSICFKKTFFEFNEKESLIYYNTEMDKFNHFYSRQHIRTITEEYNTENWVIKVMEWIDDHPDYTLIVNSDHGGQGFYGEDDVNNHGLDIDGNEAILFIYTKELKENYDNLKSENAFITKLDPSSIISQILEDINIPLQSQGIAYPLGNDPLLRFSAYKSKEIQLINQLNTYIKKYPDYKNDLDKIINKIKNTEYYKVSEDEYQKYFNEKFTNESIEFIKAIQKDIINILNNKNKSIFSHYLLFLIIFIIYLYSTIYQLYILFQLIKADGANLLLFLVVLLTSLFIIPIVNFRFTFLPIYNRLVIGIFITPFGLFISNIIIKTYFHYKNYLDSYIFVVIMGIISLLFHYSNTFLLMKRTFSSIIYSRVFNFIFIYPILYIELYYEIKRHFKGNNFTLFKYPIHKIMKAISIIFVILLVLFDVSTENHFSHHTPFNYFITILIYILFIFIFLVSSQIMKFNTKNNIKNNFGLIKLILFLYEIYINDETNRLMILLIYIILEYFSSFYYQESQNKIYQILVAILIININEIFYLITQRVYSLETSKKFFSKTFMYSIKSSKIVEGILTVFYKLRFPFITATYLLAMTPVGNSILFNDSSFILRIILNARINLNFLYFIFQFIIFKNDTDFMTIMFYSIVDSAVLVFDFINLFIYFIFCNKKGVDNISTSISIKEKYDSIK